MRHSMAVGAALTVVMLCGMATAADGLKSGPQVGDKIGAFHVLNVCNAENARANGQKTCLV